MPSLEELEEHEDSLQIAYEIAKMQVSTKDNIQNDPDESVAGANLYRYSGFIDSYFEEGDDDDDNGENYDDIEIELEYTTVKRGKSTSKKIKSNKQVVSSSSTSILPSKDYRGRYYYEKFKKGNH